MADATAPQRHHPRARAGPAGLHLLLAGRRSMPRSPCSASKYDGVVFEMEHNPWDVARAARLPAVHAQPRARSRKSGSLAPAVTPMVRIPPNGVEMNQWHRQAGARPRLLRHRLAAHQHRRRGLQRGRGLPLSAPQERRATSRPASAATGRRGACATGASRSRNTTPAPTCGRSIPKGEILVILQIEDTEGVENLDDMLKKVPGIGVILIGEGDLSPGARPSAPVRAPEGAARRWRTWSRPARSTTWWSAIRTWRPAMSSASSRKATAS